MCSFASASTSATVRFFTLLRAHALAGGVSRAGVVVLARPRGPAEDNRYEALVPQRDLDADVAGLVPQCLAAVTILASPSSKSRAICLGEVRPAAEVRRSGRGQRTPSCRAGSAMGASLHGQVPAVVDERGRGLHAPRHGHDGARWGGHHGLPGRTVTTATVRDRRRGRRQQPADGAVRAVIATMQQAAILASMSPSAGRPGAAGLRAATTRSFVMSGFPSSRSIRAVASGSVSAALSASRRRAR